MRQADAKGRSMKKPICVHLCLSVVSLLPAFAVDGTVINRTTGKPQSDATVTLYKLGQAGMESLESVHSDAQGKFSINRSTQGGPHLIQTAYDGVTYNHMLPPTAPTSGITLDVFNSAKRAGDAKISQHFLILQPSAGQMMINEIFTYRNEGKVTYNDPEGGTLKFYLPPKAKGVVKVTAKAPQGMPIQRAAEKAGRENIYKVDFAIKPGETQFDLSYMVPYTSPGVFASKVVEKTPDTLLVTPQGVALKGEGVEFSRTGPAQASIYTVKGASYKIEVTGVMKPSETESAEEGAGPSLEQVMPKLYSQINGSASLIDKLLAVKWILLLALAILGLGFTLLYRAQEPAAAGSAATTQANPDASSPSRDTSATSRDRQGAVKEKHERRRR
jgi:hypothetical protein